MLAKTQGQKPKESKNNRILAALAICFNRRGLENDKVKTEMKQVGYFLISQDCFTPDKIFDSKDDRNVVKTIREALIFLIIITS